MKILSRFALLISVLYFAVRTFADVTPSSALLLKSSSTSGAAVAEAEPSVNMDSGRYVVKSETKVVAKDEPLREQAKPVAKTPPPKKEKVEPVQAATPTPAVAPKAQMPDESFAERLQSMLLGDQEEAIKYREALHPDDRRQNFVEVQVAPSLMYLDSSSSYSYRNYSSSGSGVKVGAEIWTSPFLSFMSSYFITLESDMRADPATDRRMSVDHRFFDAGLRYRKFYNLSRRSPVTGVSVKYDEYQLIFPKKEAGRTRLKTAGIALGFDAKIPTSFTHAWIFGTEILLNPKTTEEKTALGLESGKNPKAQTYKFFVGSENSFSRNQSMFFRLSHRLDKAVYEDDANQADPISGATPSGVSVNQGTTMFEFGFTWGG